MLVANRLCGGIERLVGVGIEVFVVALPRFFKLGVVGLQLLILVRQSMTFCFVLRSFSICLQLLPTA